MHLYINSFDFTKISVEDQQNIEFNVETLFFTFNGIYQKYKEHYYKLNYESTEYEEKTVSGVNLLIQKDDTKIIKSKPLTFIPFQHYCVERKTYKVKVDENIDLVKVIDNDVYVSYFFIVNDQLNDFEDIILKIGLYLKNIIQL